MSKPKLTNDDFCRAAKRLKCDVAAIKTVADVESRGNAFYPDGFPVILFERHKFRKYTNGRFNASHPHLSGPAGGYGKAGQNQKNKFNEAFALAPEAAMKSCSWGKFQIMGFNHALCGFTSVGAFVDAMKESEGRQLDAFVGFVMHEHLADELRKHDWAGFAEGYNGANYRINKYDTKMAEAYKRFAKENINCSAAAPAELPAGNASLEKPTEEPSNQAATSPPPINVENVEQVKIDAPAPPTQTVEVQKEQVSLFTKIGAAATAATGLGINFGAIAQEKLMELSVWHLMYLIAALGLVALGVWWYTRSAKGAQTRTMQLVDKAADPSLNNVEIKQ